MSELTVKIANEQTFCVQNTIDLDLKVQGIKNTLQPNQEALVATILVARVTILEFDPKSDDGFTFPINQEAIEKVQAFTKMSPETEKELEFEFGKILKGSEIH